MPELSGIRLSLSSILLNNLSVANDKNIGFKTNFYNSYKKLIKDCDFKKPNIAEVEKLYELIQGIKRKDKTLYIVTPCCPDYSKIKIKDKYEFTFKSIGDDMGLVAERLSLNIKQIHNFLNKFSIKFKHIITIGDFEAFSASNQKRLNLNEKNYLKKLLINQNQINKYFSGNECITKKTFCEIFNGKKEWQKITKKFITEIKKNNNSKILEKEKIKIILSARIPLYKKWYGELSNKGYENILFHQASEYAAMGYLIEKKYKNAIVIGADHYRMSEFYKLGSNIPVFYLKKNYIT